MKIQISDRFVTYEYEIERDDICINDIARAINLKFPEIKCNGLIKIH